MNKQNNIRKLFIEEDVIRFQILEKNSLIDELSLPIGYNYIRSTYFKHELPTEAEIEYAINYIEDELMSNKALLNTNDQLISADENIVNLFRKNGLTELRYARQRVEDLFNQYAYIVMGASPVISGIEVNQQDVAIILILREILHHLDFDSIQLAKL
nr:hypothetical protein [uncultured Carboxylicivirga sp.]